MNSLMSLQRPSGQATVEMLIALPIVLLLIMSIIEFSLIYRAKMQLNHATFMAARAGSLNHGCKSAMYTQFHRSMTPLHMAGDNSSTRYLYVLRGKSAYFPTYTHLETLSPDKGTFDAFKERLPLHPDQIRPCGAKNNQLRPYHLNTILPHTQLSLRSQAAKTVTSKTATNGSTINIQDANLLRVRSHYCHKLVTPFLSHLISAVQSMIPNDSSPPIFYDHCIRGGGGNGFKAFQEKLLVLRSTATVRMQSPFIRSSLEKTTP